VRAAAYTPEQTAFAARAWTMRAEEERQSAAVFSELLGLLADGDVPLDVVRDVHAIVGDEIRHAGDCAAMAAALAAPAPASRLLPRAEPAPVTAEGRRSLALRIVLVEGAIGETISAALFAAGRNAAAEPRVRDLLGRILCDESLHARRFWEILDALRLERDTAELRAVATRALGLVEQLQIVPTLGRLSRGEPFDAAWAELGVLPPEARVDAFYAALERRVLPALTARGLDGAGAWARRYHGMGGTAASGA
jgi:hypothetical protein